MRAWVLFLAVAILLSFSPFQAEAVSQNCAPTAGDWFVNETVFCENEDIVFSGSLLVNASGNITFLNSKLGFNSSTDGEFGIEVNGSFYLIGSRIANSSDTNKAYTFFSNAGAQVEMRDSVIYHCGYGTTDSKKMGVYLKSDGSNITNMTFTGNNAALMVVSNGNNISGSRMSANKYGLDIRGSGNTITNNTISANSIYPLYLFGGSVVFSNNVIEDNTMDDYILFELNASLISGNRFSRNSEGIKITGRNDNVTGNLFSLTNSTAGSAVYFSDAENIRFTSNTLLDNSVYGVYFQRTKNTVMEGNHINRTSSMDFYLLSAANNIMSNNNYTKLVRKWRLDLRVLDNNNTAVGLVSVTIRNNLSMSVFSGSTDTQGRINYQIITEFMQNESGAWNYNPFSANASKTGYYGNSTAFNLTSDLSLVMIITPVPPPPENETFNFTVISPLNDTYTKRNLTTTGMLLLSVSSEKNMSWCNYTFGNASAELTKTDPKDFRAYINVSAFEGAYAVGFVCSSVDGITNSTEAYFSIYPAYECTDNDECDSDQRCLLYTCVDLECGCGYASNHACIDYACCKDSDCSGNQTCDLEGHVCAAVSCGCPEKISNHQCSIPLGYCCNDLLCEENETCEDHACVERTLSFRMPETLVYGENVTVLVLDQDDNPVSNVGIDVKYPDADPPIIESYYTDVNGKAEIPIKYWGRVNFIARKAKYFTGLSNAQIPEPMNWLFVLEIIVLIGAVAGIAVIAPKFIKKGGVSLGGLGGGPFKLEKTVSGNRVMLTLVNKTKKKLQDITVRDSVPNGAFLDSRLMPKVEPFDQANVMLTWEILELGPKEEVTIEYEARATNKGFSVLCDNKEYRA
jgi:parallel beta-helix repeat protein